MNSFDQAMLFLHTARHLQAGQVFCRVRRSMRHWWWGAINKRVPKISVPNVNMHPVFHPDGAALKMSGPWDEQVRASVRNAERLSTGEFCFLKHCVQFSSEIRWHDANPSRLWLYHLHYFDYVRDLLVQSACRDSVSAYQTFRSIASSWMDHNDRVRGDGWHPYTISIRLINWMTALSGFDKQLAADREFDLRLRQSLSSQAHILAKDLERDVRGNHLIANLRALIFWTLAIDGGLESRFLRNSLQWLMREVEEQIPADGGHFERSPGYHCIVLRHCLEIALCLQRRPKGNAPPWLDSALKRMLGYLIAILPADGKLPLLKDTTWDGPSPFDLLAAGAVYFNDLRFKKSESFGLYPLLLFGSEGWNRFRDWPLNDAPEPSRELPDSRYYVMRDDSLRDYLIFDAGKPCPDYLPAHAHADLLSYELQVSGERIVVDSGVYEYAEGMWRNHFRSTRAHNTVELAGVSQSEVWSSFRVARRARPGKVLWLSTPEYVLVQGSHDGYMRLAARALHRRTLLWKPDQFWLILDEISGTGHSRAVSYLHLQPKLALDRIEENLWRVDGTGMGLWFATFGEPRDALAHGVTDPEPQGWYSELFGMRTPNTVFSLEKAGELPFCFGYVIFKGSSGQVEFHRGADSNRIRITQAGRVSSFSISRDGTPELK